MEIIIAILGTLLIMLLVYTTWRIHHLEDERDEAREIAEEFAEKLNKRPVRIKTHIYCNGELINEKLQAVLRDLRRNPSGGKSIGRDLGSGGDTDKPEGSSAGLREHAVEPFDPYS